MSLVSLSEMEFYFTLCSPLPFPLTDKVAESPVQAFLSNVVSHTPRNWLDLVRQSDPDTQSQAVVTATSHYKERSGWPDCQHEYIILFVQLRPSPHQSTPAPDTFQIKVSRTITAHTLPARLGLWGPTEDTVEVPGSATAPNNQIQDQRLHHLTWPLNDAPSLVAISAVICDLHCKLDRYCLLQASCYAFARAVGRTIHSIFDGTAGAQQRLPFLIHESYFLYCIPSGITRAERVAAGVAQSYQFFHDV